ncbi:hypothetical protein [Hymenobacter glacialis]|uniref:hypothetical protein n=1 Tax=Hymenobacter glacialis TaxID=1908236 RepID=UPI0019D39A54|nr:hypothetical protein [Hymenobacter glacialis]
MRIQRIALIAVPAGRADKLSFARTLLLVIVREMQASAAEYGAALAGCRRTDAQVSPVAFCFQNALFTVLFPPCIFHENPIEILCWPWPVGLRVCRQRLSTEAAPIINFWSLEIYHKGHRLHPKNPYINNLLNIKAEHVQTAFASELKSPRQRFFARLRAAQASTSTRVSLETLAACGRSSCCLCPYAGFYPAHPRF